MHEGSGSADVSSISLSLIGFKPRQVILAERLQQRNSKVPILMGKSQPENIAQMKPEQESVMACSVAMWLEKKGFSKVLKRFLSAAQIEDDDWRAKALNLNEVFSKYLANDNDVHKDTNPQKKPESVVLGSAHVNGETNGRADEEIESKKKKKKNKNKGEDIWTGSGKMPQEMITNETVEKSDIYGKQEKRDMTSDVLSEEKNKCLLSKSISNKNDSDNAVEPKDKKKKKKLKDNKLDLTRECDSESKHKEVADNGDEKETRKEEATMSVELPNAGLKSKSRKRPIDGAEGGSDEYKKVSKKRKRMVADETENQSNEEVAIQVSKPKKSKGVKDGKDVQSQIKLPEDGGDTRAPNNKETSVKNIDESSKDDVKNGVEFSHSKSGRKTSEPKTVNVFQRVKIDEVKFADERLQDNSYWAKDGAEIGYGAKAQEVLGQVRGRDFRHEKTKKKRGSYRGGIIDLHSHSIKFNNSDDE